MSKTKAVLLSCFAVVAAFPPHLWGQIVGESADSPARTSLGLRAGYVWPLGMWNKSRVEPAVNLVSGSFGFDGDLEFAIAERWTLGVEGGYTSLNGSEWEEYASGKGDTIKLSGSFTHFAVLLRPHFNVTGSDIIRVEFGAAVLIANGQEELGGRIFEYDFLGSPSFGAQGGLEFMHLLNNSLALSFKVQGIFFPSAVEYLDGGTNDIILVPVTVGVRLLM
jgi:hypothetical protein